MKRVHLTDKEADLLKRAFSGSLVLKGRSLRNARSLAARGFGRLVGAKFDLLEPGRAVWVSVRERHASKPDGCDAVPFQSNDPSTWGPLTQRERKRRRSKSPVSILQSEEHIGEDHVRAAAQIARAFEMLTAGTGYRSLRYDERVDCTGHAWGESMEGFAERLQDRYDLFQRVCDQEGLDRGTMIDLLVYDQSFRAADRLNRKATGWSKIALTTVLKAYVAARSLNKKR